MVLQPNGVEDALRLYYSGTQRPPLVLLCVEAMVILRLSDPTLISVLRV